MTSVMHAGSRTIGAARCRRRALLRNLYCSAPAPALAPALSIATAIPVAVAGQRMSTPRCDCGGCTRHTCIHLRPQQHDTQSSTGVLMTTLLHGMSFPLSTKSSTSTATAPGCTTATANTAPTAGATVPACTTAIANAAPTAPTAGAAPTARHVLFMLPCYQCRQH